MCLDTRLRPQGGRSDLRPKTLGRLQGVAVDPSDRRQPARDVRGGGLPHRRTRPTLPPAVGPGGPLNVPVGRHRTPAAFQPWFCMKEGPSGIPPRAGCCPGESWSFLRRFLQVERMLTTLQRGDYPFDRGLRPAGVDPFFTGNGYRAFVRTRSTDKETLSEPPRQRHKLIAWQINSPKPAPKRAHWHHFIRMQ